MVYAATTLSIQNDHPMSNRTFKETSSFVPFYTPVPNHCP